jgi:hypothetical protein
MACIVAGLIVCLGTAARADQSVDPKSDIMVRFGAVVPACEQDWDGGAQTEVECRFWQDEHVGMAVSVGSGLWQARDEYEESYDGVSVLATSVSGDLSLIPIGVSLLYRMPVSRYVCWILEGGLRYVFVDSSVMVRVDYLEDGGGYYLEDTIRTQNFVQGMVGLSLEGSIAEPLRLIGSVGYQFDLTDPTERFGGEELGTTSFDGLMFGIGL